MLNKYNFQIRVDTSSNDLVKDFFEPALKNSIKYDRGVGYFSSGWLQNNAHGMKEFAENGGQARWITSPILSERDWEYLKKGADAQKDEHLKNLLLKEIDDLEKQLKENTLVALAWMVADSIIEFKLALPQNLLDEDFHDKFGIFTDKEGNQVSFNGSYNDSKRGMRNYEALKIFVSWNETLQEYVEDDQERFNKLWDNKDPNVRVFSLPEAATRKLVKYRSKGPRPYKCEANDGKIKLIGIDSEKTLYSYQEEAVKEWFDHNCHGIFSMATGSGKTITALAASQQLANLNLLTIAVPGKNLVEQWHEEIKEGTLYKNIFLVFDDSSQWQDQLFNQWLKLKNEGWKNTLVLIGTMHSLSDKRFQSIINDLGLPTDAMLLVDEVHNVGSNTFKTALHKDYKYRLGLSATPERKYDPEGTQRIFDYFGDIVCPYTMSQALEDGVLSKYNYNVYFAHLSEDEFNDYQSYTRKILAKRGSEYQELSQYSNEKLEQDSKTIKNWLIQRARILKKANDKIRVFDTILEENEFPKGLIYSADSEQMNAVNEVINEHKIPFIKYIGETPNQKRKKALRALENGIVSLISAIDCLDEGVDVPSVSSAVIVASSTNERQFIQRRGRILRKASKKSIAELFDVITLPPINAGSDLKWMLKSELERAKLMAELANNREEALLKIKDKTKQYGVLLTELLSM